jgi:hypothetical protein
VRSGKGARPGGRRGGTRLFAQSLPERLDLHLIEVLPLEEHFSQGDGQSGLNGQSLGIPGFGEVFLGQQSATDGFVAQRQIFRCRIGHP